MDEAELSALDAIATYLTARGSADATAMRRRALSAAMLVSDLAKRSRLLQEIEGGQAMHEVETPIETKLEPAAPRQPIAKKKVRKAEAFRCERCDRVFKRPAELARHKQACGKPKEAKAPRPERGVETLPAPAGALPEEAIASCRKALEPLPAQARRLALELLLASMPSSEQD